MWTPAHYRMWKVHFLARFGLIVDWMAGAGSFVVVTTRRGRSIFNVSQAQRSGQTQGVTEANIVHNLIKTKSRTKDHIGAVTPRWFRSRRWSVSWFRHSTPSRWIKHSLFGCMYSDRNHCVRAYFHVFIVV